MPITIRQAAADFLAEQEETVGREAYERIVAVMIRLTEGLERQGVTDPAFLELADVEGFLYAAAGDVGPSDVFYTVKSFVKWLGRRKYAVLLSQEFHASEKLLREGMKPRAAKA